LSNLIKFNFQNLFSSEVLEPAGTVLNSVQRRVTNDINNRLCRVFTEEEIKKALFQIGDLKAPGPDGLHAVFYKRYWSLIGDDLTREVMQAVNTGVIP
jgi:hypothetical protein